MAKKQTYDNESITMLKGPDKVWMAVPIRFLKSFPIPLMKPAQDTAEKLL